MNPTFTRKLGLQVQKTEVNAQKIDGLSFETFGIVIVSFSVNNEASRSQFFGEIFLIAMVSINIVLGKSFFILSNIKINCLE